MSKMELLVLHKRWWAEACAYLLAVGYLYSVSLEDSPFSIGTTSACAAIVAITCFGGVSNDAKKKTGYHLHEVFRVKDWR